MELNKLAMFCCYLQVFVAKIIGLFPYTVNKTRTSIKWSKYQFIGSLILATVMIVPQPYYISVFIGHVRQSFWTQIQDQFVVKFLLQTQITQRTLAMSTGIFVYHYNGRQIESLFNETIKFLKQIKVIVDFDFNFEKIINTASFVTSASILSYAAILSCAVFFILDNYNIELLVSILALIMPALATVIVENLFYIFASGMEFAFDQMNIQLMSKIFEGNEKLLTNNNSINACYMSDFVDSFAIFYGDLVKVCRIFLNIFHFNSVIFLLNCFVPLLVQV